MRTIQEITGLGALVDQVLGGEPTSTEIFPDQPESAYPEAPDRSPQLQSQSQVTPEEAKAFRASEQQALRTIAPLLSNPWSLIGMALPLICANAKLVGLGQPEIWIVYTVGVGAIGLVGLVASLNLLNPRLFALSVQFLLVATGSPAFVFCLLLLARK